VRTAAGGSAHLAHVKAHTSDTDIHSVGNRLTDYQANLARQQSTRSLPGCLRELPLGDCERHLCVTDEKGTGLVLIDDMRRSALSRLKSLALAKWTAKVEGQGYLAGPATMELGRIVLRHGTAAHQATFVHVATNSIEYHWLTAADNTSSLQRVLCAPCHAVLSLAHLAECPRAISAVFRSQLRRDIISLLSIVACTSDWLRDNGRLPLAGLLGSLSVIAGTASADEQPRHLTYLMSGAFTRARRPRPASLWASLPRRTAAPPSNSFACGAWSTSTESTAAGRRLLASEHTLLFILTLFPPLLPLLPLPSLFFRLIPFIPSE
jgi:hypothetical protein